MMNARNLQRGFNLVELMMVMGMMGLLGLAIFFSLQAGDVQMKTAELKMNLQDSAREGLYKMAQELRESSPSTSPVRIQIGDPASSVVFKVPHPTNPLKTDYSIDWDNAQTIQYALGGLSNHQIIRTNQSTGTTTVLANDVVQLSFVLSGRNMTISIGVQKSLSNGRVVPASPLVLTTEFEVRND